jgi:hypothetical protein
MFSAYQEYLNLSQDQNCLLGIGSDVARKCGLGGAEGDQFCTANPRELCCTATTNVVSSNTTATALPSPSQASSPDSLTFTSSATVAPTPTTSVSSVAESSNSNQGGVNPLFIAAGAVGLALIAILACALFFMTKQKPKPVTTPKQEQMDVVPVEETMEVVFEYQANLFDELSLSTRD